MLDADVFLRGRCCVVFLTEALFKDPAKIPAWCMIHLTRHWVSRRDGFPQEMAPSLGPSLGPTMPVLKKKVGHGKMKQRGFHRLALEIYQLMGQTTSTHFVAIQPSKDVKVHGRTGNHSLFFCFVERAEIRSGCESGVPN